MARSPTAIAEAGPGSDTRQLRDDLILASRILSHEGLVDSFGHVSARDPGTPHRFHISSVRAPDMVTHDDLVLLDLDGQPVTPTEQSLFRERFIHAEVYRRRPDVHAVCHHHAPALLPFCVTGVAVVPVTHLGATMGATVPFWNSADAFGDTDLLVSTPAQGAAMAEALGPHWTVLLRNHGATVVGRSVRECVFRAVYGAQNAEVQFRAMQLGRIEALPPATIEMAAALNLSPVGLDRSWERWLRRCAGTRHA